ncbi:hypothetical protein NM688_g2837 [Phlebia brevispora]|uniref:Uncharacterized protein n=1 Tax=Phlebia brevispora TaxID=194682 RepID=A0ACC1T7P5_9APHY|nr:hypothetical protein NM688_g2837 [Phlebia brevispora]
MRMTALSIKPSQTNTYKIAADSSAPILEDGHRHNIPSKQGSTQEKCDLEKGRTGQKAAKSRRSDRVRLWINRTACAKGIGARTYTSYMRGINASPITEYTRDENMSTDNEDLRVLERPPSIGISYQQLVDSPTSRWRRRCCQEILDIARRGVDP